MAVTDGHVNALELLLFAFFLGGILLYIVGYGAKQVERQLMPVIMMVGFMVIVGMVVMNWINGI